MAGELEQIQALVANFNDDAADRRALAAAVANGYANGKPLGPGTLGAVADALAGRVAVTDAVAAIEEESGLVFGPELGAGGGP